VRKVLVDTSAWIDYFRDGPGLVSELMEKALDADEVVLCGIVEMELIRGLHNKEKTKVLPLLSALPYVDIERNDFVLAGQWMAALRGRGVTVSSTDSLIATVCKKHDLSILTLDKDFKYFDEVKVYGLQ